MSITERAPQGAPSPYALEIAGIMGELQLAIVGLSVASRSHLLEMKARAPEGKHHQEARDIAIALTSRELADAVQEVTDAFARLRDESRRLSRLLMTVEDHRHIN
jgi:hypothetical protein